jgi:hypothetical protein
VKIVYDKAPSVSLTQVAKTDNYLILSWDAVENATYYEVLYEKEGQKTIEEHWGDNGTKPEFKPGGTIDWPDNPDPNKYYTVFELTGASKLAAGKYRFGVRVSSVLPSTQSSDIKWTEWYTVN